jgi:hypothetical protein
MNGRVRFKSYRMRTPWAGEGGAVYDGEKARAGTFGVWEAQSSLHVERVDTVTHGWGRLGRLYFLQEATGSQGGPPRTHSPLEGRRLWSGLGGGQGFSQSYLCFASDMRGCCPNLIGTDYFGDHPIIVQKTDDKGRDQVVTMRVIEETDLRNIFEGHGLGTSPHVDNHKALPSSEDCLILF